MNIQPRLKAGRPKTYITMQSFYSFVDIMQTNTFILPSVPRHAFTIILYSDGKQSVVTTQLYKRFFSTCIAWSLPLPPIPFASVSRFIAWHITSEGVNHDPIISPHAGELSGTIGSGKVHHGFHCSVLAVSPNRQYVAITSYSSRGGESVNQGVMLCKFDPDNGIVSEGIWLNEDHLHNTSVCFSPDNSKLYLAQHEGSLIQYDISTYTHSAITSSEYKVNNGSYYGLRLYKDVIYTLPLIGSSNTTVGAINNPNIAGAGCNYQPNAITLLPGTSSFINFSNEVILPFRDEISTIHDTICYTEHTGYTSKKLSAPSGFDQYKWNNGSSDSIRQIDAPGIYWVRYSMFGQKGHVDTFIVTEIDLSFNLENEEVLCKGNEMITLKATDSDVNYRWQDGSKQSYFNVTTPGIYWLEISAHGCTSADTITIYELQPPDLGDDIYFCKGDQIDLELSLSDIPEGALVIWNTGSNDSFISVQDSGVYWVLLAHPPCIVSDSVKVIIEMCACFASVPNAFSPNGDGLNDIFVPVIEEGCSVDNYVMSIYNRYGQRVFFSMQYQSGWKGLQNGQLADPGVYFYEISFIGGSKKEKFYFSGDITLIR